MALTAAQLVVRVKADTFAAQQGLGGLLGMMAPGAGLALGAVAVTAAVVGIGAAATKMAGDFQAGMVSLVTGAGESQANLQMVSNGILQMARDTGTSTQQLTAGMYMIESAGYHGAAGLQILQAAAEGAKVGSADLGTVADATTTIMKDYANSHVNASQAVNTLIATVANGKTHMEDLAGSLAQVLPTASAAGVGLNDVMAAMATMTGEGVPAANAATYLRQTMIALTAPSSTAQKALESVGLSTSQVATEMQKSLPGALQMITQAVAEKFPAGSAQYMAAIKDISGGSREMQGMLDLTGVHMGSFQQNVVNISGAVKKGGDSITGWSLVQGTFNQQLDKAGAVVQTLMIQLGEKLLPTTTQLVGFLADNAIPAISRLTTFLSGTSTQSQVARDVLIALGIAIGGALVAAFVAWAIAASAAAVATIAATWPVLAIGAGIALLVTGIIIAVQHWGEITDALGRFKAMLGGVKDDIGGFVGGAMSALGTSVHNLGVDILNFDAQAVKWGENLITMFVQGITNNDGKIKDAVSGIASNIKSFLGFHSPAEQGPGSDADTWMPNLGKMLADGLSGQQGSVAQAAAALAAGIAAPITALSGASVPGAPGAGAVGGVPLTIPIVAAAATTPGGALSNPTAGPAGYGSAAGGYGASGGASASQGQAIILQVDGRTLARVLAPYLPGIISSATGVRTF